MSMSDREMLELAAMAAGLKPDAWLLVNCNRSDLLILNEKGWHTVWNPLEDDGDALRLAVKLRIDVLFDGHDSPNAHVETAANMPGLYIQPWWHEPLKFDEKAATRRAITRAAAEMQRNRSNSNAG